MRIRDATITKFRERAATSVFMSSRCRSMELCNSTTTFFLSELGKCVEEQRLVMERKNGIASTEFDLGVLDDGVCLERFRFTKSDIYRIAQYMQWDEENNVTRRRCYRTNVIFSLCILLRRLGTVCRWSDLQYEFGRSEAVMLEIFYETLELFEIRFANLIMTFQDELLTRRADMYAAAIEDVGASLPSCVGFLDATNIYIARPSGSRQRATYNGHKRRNSIKMQAMSLPDGLIFHVAGPIEGRRHDLMLFRRSGLEEELAEHLVIDGEQYCIYADPAYVLRPYLQVGLEDAALPAEQRQFNKDVCGALGGGVGIQGRSEVLHAAGLPTKDGSREGTGGEAVDGIDGVVEL